MKNKLLALALTSSLLISCGVGNNISVTTTNGACANGESFAPYCLSVAVQNNAGGQNFINSTIFPINNLTVTISGVNNVLSPAVTTSMDPNGCLTTTINPGGSCTFFLQLSNESYPVNSLENVNVTLNYNVLNSFMQNTFLGGTSSTTGSTSFTVYQFTNLYMMQSNGWLSYYNQLNTSPVWVESADTVNSLAIDNSAYGYLYLGGNLGIYPYGIESAAAPSISAGISGANNLLTVSSMLYATGMNGNTGIWAYSLSGESWSSSAVSSFGNNFVTNANAVSPSLTMYFVNGMQQNAVYFCLPTSSTISNCQPEGSGIVNSNGGAVIITSLGFISGANSPYTGLFAGTNSGLYAESGTTPATTGVGWNSFSNVTNPITSIVTNNNTLFAGDSFGNIWQVNGSSLQTPPTATNFVASSSINSPITKMQVDTIGNTLYFIAGNSSSYNLYSCSLAVTTCSPQLIKALPNNSSFIGMGIGSQLNNTN